jgi:hypothetical protein
MQSRGISDRMVERSKAERVVTRVPPELAEANGEATMMAT